MPSGQQTPSPTTPARNSLCRALGHDWAKTTAGNYRRCQRAHCRAVQRLVGGRWLTVSVLRAQTSTAPTQAQPQQAALWHGEGLSCSPELS